jgi:hypothetical protein
MKDKIAKLLRLARSVEDDVAGDLELEGLAADACELIEEMAAVAGVRVDDVE